MAGKLIKEYFKPKIYDSRKNQDSNSNGDRNTMKRKAVEAPVLIPSKVFKQTTNFKSKQKKTMKLNLKWCRYNEQQKVWELVKQNDGSGPRYLKLIEGESLNFKEIKEKAVNLYFDVTPGCNAFSEHKSQCYFTLVDSTGQPLSEEMDFWKYGEEKGLYLSRLTLTLFSMSINFDIVPKPVALEENVEVIVVSNVDDINNVTMPISVSETENSNIMMVSSINQENNVEKPKVPAAPIEDSEKIVVSSIEENGISRKKLIDFCAKTKPVIPAASVDHSFYEKLKFIKKTLLEHCEDEHLELQIRRRKVWEDTVTKLPRLMKRSSTYNFLVRFIGEEAADQGGPLREYFSLVFEDAARYIFQGCEKFTFLHDLFRIRNGEFQLFGYIVALSLLHGCPGPRFMQKPLVHALLDLPFSGTSDDIPDYELQRKVKQIERAETNKEFQHLISTFTERFDMGVLKHRVDFSEKQEFVNTIVKQLTVSTCREEIEECKTGLSFFGVLDVLKEHSEDAIRELCRGSEKGAVNDVLKLFSPSYTETSQGDIVKSDKKCKEEDIYFNFTNFVESLHEDDRNYSLNVIDVETGDTTTKHVTINDFLMFCTGSRYISQSMKGTGKIKFHHLDSNDHCKGMRVVANTCDLTLTFPVNERYINQPQTFINNFIEDIYSSPGFGKK